jgi:hypothetical protein
VIYGMSKGHRLRAFEDCERCEGLGFIVTGHSAGFCASNMEVYAKEEGYFCPDCEQRNELGDDTPSITKENLEIFAKWAKDLTGF